MPRRTAYGVRGSFLNLDSECRKRNTLPAFSLSGRHSEGALFAALLFCHHEWYELQQLGTHTKDFAMARLRTFVALDPGDALRGRLGALQEKLADSTPGVKWVESENLHLTLLFLGDVDDRDLMKVCRAADRAAQDHAPFVVSLEGVGCFPNMRRPRTIWAGIGSGAVEVVKLFEDLATALESQGLYRPEDRPFEPHVTLGRVNKDADAEALGRELAKHQKWRGGETTIEEVLVLSSDLTPKGPEYTVLGRGKLRAKKA
jgi:2'-5' RNA ligase